ncbi:MAG: hypothetical protein EOO89_16905 [Pedobacter sp.]|nr:MAG: hypothetical protein EOO89_16905 [Pedobacter sp.]
MQWEKAERNLSATYAKLTIEERKWVDSLENGFGPSSGGLGCSWYCGGQMTKATASSTLPSSPTATFDADNIHDFDLLTSWVPQSSKGGIGEKISFHFAPLSPRVNEIIIYNGYLKTFDLFKANARAKTLKLYIDVFHDHLTTIYFNSFLINSL